MAPSNELCTNPAPRPGMASSLVEGLKTQSHAVELFELFVLSSSLRGPGAPTLDAIVASDASALGARPNWARQQQSCNLSRFCNAEAHWGPNLHGVLHLSSPDGLNTHSASPASPASPLLEAGVTNPPRPRRPSESSGLASGTSAQNPASQSSSKQFETQSHCAADGISSEPQEDAFAGTFTSRDLRPKPHIPTYHTPMYAKSRMYFQEKTLCALLARTPSHESPTHTKHATVSGRDVSIRGLTGCAGRPRQRRRKRRSHLCPPRPRPRKR